MKQWNNAGPHLDCIEVPGGWLYRYERLRGEPCMTFVPFRFCWSCGASSKEEHHENCGYKGAVT